MSFQQIRGGEVVETIWTRKCSNDMEISTSYKATQISNDRVVSSIAIIQNQQIYDVFPVPVFGCIVGEGFILGAWENDIE